MYFSRSPQVHAHPRAPFERRAEEFEQEAMLPLPGARVQACVYICIWADI